MSALFVAIMPSHGEHVDTNGLFVDGIDESGSFVNASAPQTGEVAFEGFGFAGAGLGVHFESFEQCHDFLQYLFLPRSFPIGKIFDGFREQLQIVVHRSTNRLISSIEKVCANPAACCCKPRRCFADGQTRHRQRVTRVGRRTARWPPRSANLRCRFLATSRCGAPWRRAFAAPLRAG